MNLTEYDSRQISLMKDRLDLFISKKLSLKNLINDLRGLLDCLEFVDIAWKEEFYEHWFMLEQVYAVSLDRNESISSDDPYVMEAVDKLDILLTL